jgi:hypothetical protein
MSRPMESGAAAAGDERAAIASPPRLADASTPDADRVAAALLAANRFWQADTSAEARAWYALQRRREPARSRRAWRTGALAMAVVALVVIAGVVRRPSRPTKVAAGPVPPPASRVAPPPAVIPYQPPRVAGGGGDVVAGTPARANDSGAPLPAPIRAELVAANGVRARLSKQGVATLLPDSSGRAAIALERGALDVDADAATTGGAPRAESGLEAVTVRASSLRILGERGRFHVDTDGARVGVTVQSGGVRIYSSRRLVARVFAGQHWSFVPRAGATHARAPALAPGAAAAPEATPAPDRDCLHHARAGATDRAIACFQEQAAEGGLTAEVALLEIARLRRDVSGDLGGAERALDEYRQRFPRGTLSAEAGIARVELLLRLGRPNEALVEARALPEGEGDFWRAVCLAKLGRRDEARGVLDGYLARPDAARRREAQRRRAELAP